MAVGARRQVRVLGVGPSRIGATPGGVRDALRGQRLLLPELLVAAAILAAGRCLVPPLQVLVRRREVDASDVVELKLRAASATSPAPSAQSIAKEVWVAGGQRSLPRTAPLTVGPSDTPLRPSVAPVKTLGSPMAWPSQS